MVNLWWIRGESWCVDGGFLDAKNMPRISDLFSFAFTGMMGGGSMAGVGAASAGDHDQYHFGREDSEAYGGAVSGGGRAGELWLRGFGASGGDVYRPEWSAGCDCRGGVAKHRSCQGADAVCDGRGTDGDRERNDYGPGPELGGEVPGGRQGGAGAEGDVHDRSGEGTGADRQYGRRFHCCREGGDVCHPGGGGIERDSLPDC